MRPTPPSERDPPAGQRHDASRATPRVAAICSRRATEVHPGSAGRPLRRKARGSRVARARPGRGSDAERCRQGDQCEDGSAGGRAAGGLRAAFSNWRTSWADTDRIADCLERAAGPGAECPDGLPIRRFCFARGSGAREAEGSKALPPAPGCACWGAVFGGWGGSCRMRKPWIVGMLAGLVLLAACGDPSSGPEAAPARPLGTQLLVDPASAPGGRRRSGNRRTEVRLPGRGPWAPREAPHRALPRRLPRHGEPEGARQGSCATESGRATPAPPTRAPPSATTWRARARTRSSRRRTRPPRWCVRCGRTSWCCSSGATRGTTRRAWTASPTTSARDKYFARYTADARRLTDQIAGAAGGDAAKIVWVLQGPDPMTPDRVRRVNAVYERQADASGDLLADAGKAVSPASARYTWAQYLPCTAYEREHAAYCTQPGSGRTALHRDDDYLHFCLAPTTSTPKPCPVRSPGILRITRAITQVVASELN